jgi:hypothetical protein
MTASTRHPELLCHPALLLRRALALAVLDAAMSPEWQYRYYSFDARWGDGEYMASMRNGSGDALFIAFGAAGAFVKGFAHEAPMAHPSDGNAVWPGMFDGLPSSLESFRLEPAFTPDETTYSMWWPADGDRWQLGVRKFPSGGDPDGSEEQLAIYDGNPSRYVEFAYDYFEAEVPFSVVKAVYDHAPLTDAMVVALNADADAQQVIADAKEMGYGTL